MGSVQNWLGFSPSPHLTIDMVQESSWSQSSSCIVHSNVQESSTGFDQLPQNTPTLRMSDGSLHTLVSLNRTDNEGWHTKTLEHSRTMDRDSGLLSQHSINADLSMLVGGTSDHLCSSSQYDDHIVQNNSKPEGQGPKLEDFLGTASLGEGHYSHGRSEVQTSALEDMYGTAPSFKYVDPLAMTMIVADSRLTLRGVPNCLPAFDIADSELSTSCKHSQQTEDQTLKAAANRFFNDSYDQNSKNEYIFHDCNLRLPQSPGVNNMNGLSTVKTWSKNHPSVSESNPSVSESNYTATPKEGLGVLTNIQSLSLSMSTSSQSSSLLVPSQNSILDTCLSEIKKRSLDSTSTSEDCASRKSIDTFGQRTSVYRGVTRHRWTGRYEAHLWDNSCRREGQTRKGRQVYLGGYDKEEKAARAYDLAALKYWGLTTTTNFPVTDYERELEEMKHMTRQEYVASLRRKSSGFSRGASIYRGVTRHHQHGRWQARIGRVAGNKDLYLGTFSTQEEAAEAYDLAAIKFRGLNAVTNFDMSRYDVKSIIASSTLPVGGHVKRTKESSQRLCDPRVDGRRTDEDLNSYTTGYSNSNASKTGHEWPLNIAFEQLANEQRSSSRCKLEALDHHTNQNPEHQKFLQLESMVTTNATVPHNPMSAFESPAVGINNNIIAASSTSGLFSNNVSSDLGGSGLLMAINPSLQCGAEHNSLRAPFNQNKQATHNNDLKASAYENMIFGDTCSRSVYYLQPQQSSAHAAKGNSNLCENAYNNWMTIPAQSSLAPRNNLAAACHAPIFSIWSDT